MANLSSAFSEFIDQSGGISISDLSNIEDAVYSGIRDNYDDADEADRNVETVMALTKVPISVSQLKIIYHISRYGEFPDITVDYQTNGSITLEQIFETMDAFYSQPLSLENVEAYIAENDVYSVLRDNTQPRLHDAMLGRILIEGLDETPEGYRLALGS